MSQCERINIICSLCAPRLCYLFCRCTRSVSVCPPAYYAHLAALRGKIMCLHADSESDTASSTGAGFQGLAAT